MEEEILTGSEAVTGAFNVRFMEATKVSTPITKMRIKITVILVALLIYF
jgi:hypothetical protein